MDFRTHRVAGICTGLVAASMVVPVPYTTQSLVAYGIIVLSSAAGSYIPDIDEPSSKIGKVFKPISMAIKGVAGHRGIMHTPLMAGLLLLLLFFIQGEYIDVNYKLYFDYILLGIITGFLSHLFVDTLTVNGVQWLWPISSKRFSIAHLHTNNKGHQFLVRIAFFILSFLILYFYREDSIMEMFALL